MDGFIVEFNGDRDWLVGEELEKWIGEWDRDEESGALVFADLGDAKRFAEEYYAQRRRMDEGTEPKDYDPNTAEGIAVTVVAYADGEELNALGYVDPYDGKFLDVHNGVV